MNRRQAPEKEQKLIIVDPEDRILGFKNRNECHKGNGILHRAFSIFIFNDKKELLLQKRSKAKLLWPLFWSNSACSHPWVGEAFNETVRIRLMEELGIKAPLRFLFKFQYQARYRDVGSENEICSVFIGKTNETIRPNKHEIDDWKFIGISELNANIQKYPNQYTPWFKIEWERIQEEYLITINGLLPCG